MFGRVLIANRGEIACRIARSCRDLGVDTVAVYSDADADAPHVQLCTEGRRLGEAPARSSYLNAEAILAAARASGAEAIHPGYGFLAENADFAQACLAAGLVFVGPSPRVIRELGDKQAAKNLMAAAGVPVLPGYGDEQQDDERLRVEAGRLGYPLLVKPLAGGGGKGMRLVTDDGDLSAALQAARREARAAFGDQRLLLERYVPSARHVEVQILCDHHGTCLHLFERDCSIQRRHQKVIEEAPAPGLDQALRDTLGETAVSAARAAGYTGAGTVEFLLEPDGRFHFLEMNTRLQVEHPVTEMVTGLDLVAWQLRIAAGQALPTDPSWIRLTGHAVEARVCAEDPRRAFLPSTGRIGHLVWPRQGPDLRVDSGVSAGSRISPHYDSMLAKIIAHGQDRVTALQRLHRALSRVECLGVETNIDLLRGVLARLLDQQTPPDTAFLERHEELLAADKPDGPSPQALAMLAAHETLNGQRAAAREARGLGDPSSPWALADGWRLNGPARSYLEFDHEGEVHSVTITHHKPDLEIRWEGQRALLRHMRLRSGVLRAEVDGCSTEARIVVEGARRHLWWQDRHWTLRVPELVPSDQPGTGSGGVVQAPIPGQVVALCVAEGQRVSKGERLLILEAMKMEHTLVAPCSGTVQSIRVRAGERVRREGSTVLIMAPEEPGDSTVP